ncbi:MAG: arylesterase [Verrucomicrobia bacterium]|nr:arylesterase [Verrucomicrobiota bacterium]
MGVFFVILPGSSQPGKPDSENPLRRIVILGDSITAGYGLDPSEAYPALLQKRITEHRLPYKVINAGVSGDTTSGGVRRTDWVLKQEADVLVLALGGNDGLRGISPAVTQSNLLTIIERARIRTPEIRVLVAGMQMPPSMGEDYARSYREIFPEVAKQARVSLIPFLLEGVGALPEMNQPDLIHPTAEGQRRIADTVWKSLEPLLARK